MSGSDAHCSLQSSMGLQKKIMNSLSCDSTIHTRPILRIALIVHVRIFRVGRIESRVMTFADDNDFDFRHRLRAVDILTSLSNLR